MAGGSDEKPSGLQSCMAACCCLEIKQRDVVNEWMLSTNETKAPSLCQRLCFCQCGPSVRKPSGIEAVPQLRGLAGVMVQAGDHNTAGSLQTLKWANWDPVKRQADLQVWGGFSGCGRGSEVGLWTEPVKPLWCFLMNLARVGNYTYRFKFSEDYRRADIGISGNPLIFCCSCLCIPCMPGWLFVPKCITAFEMVQADDSTDGSSWKRNNSVCGSEFKFFYNLQEVFTPEGQPAKYHDKLTMAPQQVMITYWCDRQTPSLQEVLTPEIQPGKYHSKLKFACPPILTLAPFE